MKEFLISLLHTFGLAWWVELKTDNPQCTYYFGPFLTSKEAQKAKGGYIEDLEQEGAQGIAVSIRRCKPPVLTIADDLGEAERRGGVPVFSSQL